MYISKRDELKKKNPEFHRGCVAAMLTKCLIKRKREMGEGREGGEGGSSSVGSSRCFSFRFSRGRESQRAEDYS